MTSRTESDQARPPGDPAPAQPSSAPPPDPAATDEGPRGTPRHPAHRNSVDWPEARRIAADAPTGPLPTVVLPLAEARGRVLAQPLTALTDLPAFDTSAMDGWAVAGPGPWRLSGRVLAGEQGPVSLPDGTAVGIATGARLPRGATAVLRSEHGTVRRGTLHATEPGGPQPGQDVRPRGQECHSGDELLPAGAVVTPVVLGLAAAAGYDELALFPRPTVEVLVLGDELLTAGLPEDGRIRDALGPFLHPWLCALGAEVLATRRITDEAEALLDAVANSAADVVVTTGGTASGPVDFVKPVLRRLGAGLLVDGVRVRPGHPMLLAELPGGRHLVGLPGNPLAAVSGVVTLVQPLLRALAGHPAPPTGTARAAAAVPGHPVDTRLVPVALGSGAEVPPLARPLRFNGPAMLRGLATADALAVVPPGGSAAGDDVELLALPWARTALPAGASESPSPT
ncbi:molybdopterin biosynthesis protein [Wenjunlia vitaminophila]|uniref:Molybdopterin molybdenumtransferase n=1 Tax=Wenjunlia vitaminophila TaxID=76728 RepID=A0A0T6LN90_WENVI|nr:molybdopterin molybdotransferase MoeA [Wenjunlia vitaminophila]KRV47385.1 molybdopterin biosynthesis protein [Wenjunlia vitaminophila]